MPIFSQDSSGLVLPVETRNTAIDGDYLFMIDANTSIPYKITKANLLAGLSSSGSTSTSGNGGNTSGSGNSNNSNDVNRLFNSNGDTNGVFYYLGTSLGRAAWKNPAGSNLIITASSTEFGNPNTLSGRSPSEWFSHPVQNSFVSFYLDGHLLTCNHYSIQTRANDPDYYPRNWYLQGSNDGAAWATLDTQTNNTSLSAVAQWLDLPVVSSTSYKYFRILQFDNDSNNSPYLCLGQVELYGVFTP